MKRTLDYTPSYKDIASYANLVGDFQDESKVTQNHIQELYRKFRKQEKKAYTKDNIAPIKEKNVRFNLNNITTQKKAILHKIAYRSAQKLHYVTSSAGQWTRGKIKGIAKGLVPYNLKSIVGAKKAKQIVQLDELLASNDPEVVRRLAKRLSLPGRRRIKQIKKQAAKRLKSIVQKASGDFENAINPIDIKFLNVAKLSKKSNEYVPFDIITGEHTHKEIVEYVQRFRNNFMNKKFHPDPKKNQEAIDALAAYFKKSDKLKDTHVLGYQRGIRAIDPETGKYIRGSPTSSIGAGNFMDVLENSGRMSVHNREIYHFDNIEVVSNLEDTLAMHVLGNSNVSITVVRSRAGYVGGSPYAVKKMGGYKSTELVEDYLVPKEIKDQGELFNTGSITINRSAKRPSEISFETKTDKNTGKKIIRAKLTPGDFTQNNSTNIILGRLSDDPHIQRDYENFKSWKDYLNNGVFYLKTFFNNF